MSEIKTQDKDECTMVPDPVLNLVFPAVAAATACILFPIAVISILMTRIKRIASRDSLSVSADPEGKEEFLLSAAVRSGASG